MDFSHNGNLSRSVFMLYSVLNWTQCSHLLFVGWRDGFGRLWKNIFQSLSPSTQLTIRRRKSSFTVLEVFAFYMIANSGFYAWGFQSPVRRWLSSLIEEFRLMYDVSYWIEQKQLTGFESTLLTPCSEPEQLAQLFWGENLMLAN